MRPGPRIALWLAVLSAAAFACTADAARSRVDPLRGLVEGIVATRRPDSTAVLVVADTDLLEYLLARLPQGVVVMPIALPSETPTPAQIGQMFRETSAATMGYTDVWVLGRSSSSRLLRRAAAVAEMLARLSRIRTLRDSVTTSRGTVTFAQWVDLPGGVAQRAETRQALADADSVLARGTPRLVPITRPFTPRELEVDRDTVAYYVSQLADTSFYTIGGCSEVEIVNWSAPEKLGQMGPGVVPVLVHRIADPDPFVRERVQEALLFATQDERVLARTGGDYLKFYDQPERSPSDIVGEWWTKFGHFWTPADTAR